MNKSELESIINAIMERGDSKYTTPSGAFLEVLREIAKQNRIEALSECLSLYCDAHPAARHFLAARVPGILVNHNFPIRQDLNFDNFILWSVSQQNWAEGIINNAFDGNKLIIEIERIISASNNYSRTNY